jgi:hypothetical protein
LGRWRVHICGRQQNDPAIGHAKGKRPAPVRVIEADLDPPSREDRHPPHTRMQEERPISWRPEDGFSPAIFEPAHIDAKQLNVPGRGRHRERGLATYCGQGQAVESRWQSRYLSRLKVDNDRRAADSLRSSELPRANVRDLDVARGLVRVALGIVGHLVFSYEHHRSTGGNSRAR